MEYSLPVVRAPTGTSRARGTRHRAAAVLERRVAITPRAAVNRPRPAAREGPLGKRGRLRTPLPPAPEAVARCSLNSSLLSRSMHRTANTAHSDRSRFRSHHHHHFHPNSPLLSVCRHRSCRPHLPSPPAPALAPRNTSSRRSARSACPRPRATAATMRRTHLARARARATTDG